MMLRNSSTPYGSHGCIRDMVSLKLSSPLGSLVSGALNGVIMALECLRFPKLIFPS